MASLGVAYRYADSTPTATSRTDRSACSRCRARSTGTSRRPAQPDRAAAARLLTGAPFFDMLGHGPPVPQAPRHHHALLSALSPSPDLVLALRGSVGASLRRQPRRHPGRRALLCRRRRLDPRHPLPAGGPARRRRRPAGRPLRRSRPASSCAPLHARIWAPWSSSTAAPSSTASIPTRASGVQFGAGPGLRYYTPIGPLRLDVGFPLDPGPVSTTGSALFKRRPSC